MARLNFGAEVKKRTKRLVEALLLHANHDLAGSETLQIQINWQTQQRLVIRTKLRFLEALTVLDPHYGKLSGSEIKEALNRLKDFVEILDDHRIATQGSDTWHFTLNLWHHRSEIAANLGRLDEEWERCKQLRSARSLTLSPARSSEQGMGLTRPPEAPSPPEPNAFAAATANQQDWGEALNVASFYGRTEEIATLQQWILAERCRLVALVGMGGLGKTTLSIRLAETVQDEFDYLIWRSLRNAPPLETVMLALMQFFSDPQTITLPTSPDAQIKRLLTDLRQNRCLIILDNTESIFQASSQSGQFLPGYDDYGLLFKAIGETTHQSCLVLTSREKPRQVAVLEGQSAPVRSLSLSGLTPAEGQAIFAARGCYGASEGELQDIFDHYAGNPLALQIVAASVQDITGGDIAEILPFLHQGRWQFQDINDLLARQFERLSAIEQQVMYWLAINREPLSLQDLATDVRSATAKQQLLGAIQSLSHRCLVERSGKHLSLQPVVMEYVTQRLLTHAAGEIIQQQPGLLQEYALIKAQSIDHLRKTQIRLILDPLLHRLMTTLGSAARVERQLRSLLMQLHQDSLQQRGYLGGNLLNLLGQLNSDLSQLDCSNLTIWQADLTQVTLHQVNFANANFAQSVFTETLGITASVDFSPDGQLLACGCANGKILLWRVADGKKLFTYQDQSNYVCWSVRFSPDGKTLASGSSDRTIKLWDVETGVCLQTYSGHTGWIWSVRFSPDGKTLASGSGDCTIKLWDVQTGACLNTLQGHQDGVFSIAFSPDGQTLASGSEEATVRLWSVVTGKSLHVVKAHEGITFVVAFSLDGNLLASGGEDAIIKLWDIQTGTCLHTLAEHTGSILTIGFSPNQELLISSGRDGLIKLWDLESRQCIKTLHDHAARVFSIALHPDGRTLASGSDDKTVRLWNIESGDCLRVLQGYSNGIRSVRFSPNGKTLICGSEDKTLHLWHLSSQQLVKQLRGHTSWVTCVGVSSDGQTLASGSDDGTIKLWNLDTGHCWQTLQASKQYVFSVAFHPEGHRLASSSGESVVKLWTLKGNQPSLLQGHRNRIWTTDFSPTGDLLLSCSHDQTIKLWGLPSGDCLKTLEGHEGVVFTASFSPEGQQIASGSDDQTIRLWSVQTGQCLKTLVGHQGLIFSVAFSPDGQLLASGSNDKTVRLWDLKTGLCLGVLSGHDSTVFSVVFSPDGKCLASGSQDGTVKLWNPQTWECIATLRSRRPYEGMNITGVSGLTQAEKATLKELGAVERE